MRNLILGSAMSLGILLGAANADAQMSHKTETEVTFRQIDQPLWVRSVVTIVGVSLIGVELWWFLFYRSRIKQRNESLD